LLLSKNHFAFFSIAQIFMPELCFVYIFSNSGKYFS